MAFTTTNTGTGTLPSGYSYTTVAGVLSINDQIWSGTPYAGNPGGAWYFSAINSNQGDGESNAFNAMAVRPGQVSAKLT